MEMMGRCVFGVLLTLAMIGCGSGTAPVKVQPTATPAAQTVKATLEQVAESGELGSGAEELQKALEEMKASDPAKADALLSDFESLKNSSGASAKSKAKAMLGKM
ncbi:hypothetical protein [Rosistilla oblonga]|uniref:hypothetical protein n=1 Tax=Rosistilla oblonga TaxID=2527990 RepID=UPI0018D271D6|nr:hypothetical protein [Rosistilla oblonga]|eukprot:TRINITY_DN46834_c0_g1_i1.p3 TRINITY_DN46834_c0_g1~~TRINITY_DN46834_c0_g1_i1.p3  ORF type:complete len:105 (-),score=13.84 TRINITY_DN46834_c0_g1_i1:43-357(-)